MYRQASYLQCVILASIHLIPITSAFQSVPFSIRKCPRHIISHRGAASIISPKTRLDCNHHGIHQHNIENTLERDPACRSEFIQQVTSFLDKEDMPYRKLRHEEICHVLQSYASQQQRINSTATSIRLESMLKERTILLVGKGYQHSLQNNNNTCSVQNVFLLHICPTMYLSDVQDVYQRHYHPSGITTTTSRAIASYAWLNSQLTNAFSQTNPTRHHLDIMQKINRNNHPLTIVHLHQDVWHRSSEIVQSRLRSKLGIHNNCRIYARKTTVRRISKSVYLPFLTEHHLWGGTGAKFGYGLYYLPSSKTKTITIDEDKEDEKEEEPQLMAVATFSSKRKVVRNGNIYHSYELLRFCTRRDTTVVGGLTKLISAFVKDVSEKQQDDVGVDIITSIDRDFGSNTWPNFVTVDIMDPVPMFVGVDGIRRHAVGAGLISLDLCQDGNEGAVRGSDMLRAGLPLSLMDDMNNMTTDDNIGLCNPWEIAANEGFHPVFDAGVERLMHVVNRPSREQQNAECASSAASLAELWETSVPRFVTKHYSPNSGVERMLQCIREVKV